MLRFPQPFSSPLRGLQASLLSPLQTPEFTQELPSGMCPAQPSRGIPFQGQIFRRKDSLQHEVAWYSLHTRGPKYVPQLSPKSRAAESQGLCPKVGPRTRSLCAQVCPVHQLCDRLSQPKSDLPVLESAERRKPVIGPDPWALGCAEGVTTPLSPSLVTVFTPPQGGQMSSGHLPWPQRVLGRGRHSTVFSVGSPPHPPHPQCGPREVGPRGPPRQAAWPLAQFGSISATSG